MSSTPDWLQSLLERADVTQEALLQALKTQIEAQVILCLVVALLTAVCWWVLWNRNTKNEPDDANDDPVMQFKPCPNPDCVRCRKYKQVNERARDRLGGMITHSEGDPAQRIIQAVRRGPRPSNLERQNNNNQLPYPQYPNVLWVPELSAQPFVTALHPQACAQIEQFHDEILMEYHKANASIGASGGWLSNDVTAGQWHALHLVNQGVWNKALVDAYCPITAAAVRNLPNFVKQPCVFCNVFFSVVLAGTVIEPHCGPCNVRHRLHLTLLNAGSLEDDESEKKETEDSAKRRHNDKQEPPPSGPVLQVCQETQTWEPGKAFCFDDSLVHSVQFPEAGTDEDLVPPRVVLIVDLWHPELNKAERQLISELYEASST